MSMMRRRLAGQEGFSLLVVLGVLTICSALTVATFAAVVGDMPLRKESRERKMAFAAAEAGLNFYMSRLNQDNEYWTLCNTGPAPNGSENNPVNQPWNGTGADPRKFRYVPGDPSAQYTVELLPAVGSQCLTGSAAAGSMIDPSTGTMRIRATGKAGRERRTILATLRRKSFLDYVYFTDYEVTDPAALTSDATYIANCSKYRASRPQPTASNACFDIQFASADKVNGPFHTNDDILACPGSTFGRSAADRLEASGSTPGWANPGSGCGSGSPTFKSTFQGGVPALAVPTSNAKVAAAAVAPYILTGTNTVVINNGQMTVTPAGGSATTMALPANGVIYDRSGSGCGAGSSPVFQEYNEAAGCANLTVHGTYSKSLTLVSDKDIIIDGNVTRNGDYLLGLVASNYVRIQHKVTGRSGLDCTNVAPVIPSPLRIDAAILTLQHSFIVDNYYCGDALGTLQVNGAIAQRFRGPVGATDSDGAHGYLKDYNYDDRFKFRNPPYFLEPEAAAWRILRRNEQVPGVGTGSGT